MKKIGPCHFNAINSVFACFILTPPSPLKDVWRGPLQWFFFPYCQTNKKKMYQKGILDIDEKKDIFQWTQNYFIIFIVCRSDSDVDYHRQIR